MEDPTKQHPFCGRDNLRRADALRLLMQKPRTVAEVADLIAVERKCMDRWFAALWFEGLASRERQSHKTSPFVYTWVGLGE